MFTPQSAVVRSRPFPARPPAKRVPTTSMAPATLSTAASTSASVYADARGGRSRAILEGELAFHRRHVRRRQPDAGRAVVDVGCKENAGARFIRAQQPLRLHAGRSDLVASPFLPAESDDLVLDRVRFVFGLRQLASGRVDDAAKAPRVPQQCRQLRQTSLPHVPGPGAWRAAIKRPTVFASRPVSRVLSGGSPLRDGHSSGARIAPHLEQPTRAAAGISLGRRVAPAPMPPLFGLAPGGVCRAASVTGGAVRSYRTVSPLPWRVAPRRRSLLCGTFPGVAPGGR